MDKNLKPLVSVLMPVYNAENFLKEAIDSILCQSYKNFEFIIINDGSTDKSLNIIKSYKNKRIKLINHKTNKGLIFSLNEGIKIAKGKYIVRMDADDISLKNRIRIQTKYMESHPKIGICGTWIETFGSGSSIWETSKNSDYIKTRMLMESSIAHPSVIIRKNALLDNNLFYRKDYIHAEDYDLWVRAADIFPVTNIQQTLLRYRVHKDQIGKLHKTRQNVSSMKVRTNQLNKLGIKPNKIEKKIHLNIGEWRGAKTRKELFEMKKWIEKIYFSNKKTKRYNEKILRKLLTERWIGMVLLPKKTQFKMLPHIFSIHPVFWLEITRAIPTIGIRKIKKLNIL